MMHKKDVIYCGGEYASFLETRKQYVPMFRLIADTKVKGQKDTNLKGEEDIWWK